MTSRSATPPSARPPRTGGPVRRMGTPRREPDDGGRSSRTRSAGRPRRPRPHPCPRRGTIEEEVVMTTAPSDEDLEAAAEHFAPPCDEPATAAPRGRRHRRRRRGVRGRRRDRSRYAGRGRWRPGDSGDEVGRHPGRPASRRRTTDRHGRQHGGPRRPQLAGIDDRRGRRRRRTPRTPGGRTRRSRRVPDRCRARRRRPGRPADRQGRVRCHRGGRRVAGPGRAVRRHGEAPPSAGHRRRAGRRARSCWPVRYFKGEGAVLAMFALGVVATFLWFMARPGEHPQGHGGQHRAHRSSTWPGSRCSAATSSSC